MKKLRIAGLLLLAPLTLLTACGGESKLELNSNWYANTTANEVRGTETLTYDVSFIKPTTEGAFGVVYEGGTYTTALSGETVTIAGVGDETVYVYTTTLNVNGYYFLNDQKSSFSDEVTTSVKFRRADFGLSPISSTSDVSATVLLTANPTTLDGAIKETHITRETKYDLSTNKATVTTTDLTKQTPTPATQEFVLPNGTFFDNEQLLFALRSISLEKQVGVYSIDPQTNTLEQVVTYSPTAVDYSMSGVSINGEPCSAEKVSAYSMTVNYNKIMSGNGRTVWYAQKTSNNSNTYRNVMLCMETPLLYNLGTIRYSLKTANFA